MSKRRQYSQEFKHEAVELARMPGASIGEIARDLGINANMLARWRREASERGNRAFAGSGAPRDEELVEQVFRHVFVRYPDGQQSAGHGAEPRISRSINGLGSSTGVEKYHLKLDPTHGDGLANGNVLFNIICITRTTL